MLTKNTLAEEISVAILNTHKTSFSVTLSQPLGGEMSGPTWACMGLKGQVGQGPGPAIPILKSLGFRHIHTSVSLQNATGCYYKKILLSVLSFL